MKWLKALVIALVTVSVAGVASSGWAAEDEAAAIEKKAEIAIEEMATVVGIVNVTKDSNGEVTGVELKTDDGVEYQVVMNAEGKALEKEIGKKVEASGILFEKDGKKILDVKSCKVEARSFER